MNETSRLHQLFAKRTAPRKDYFHGLSQMSRPTDLTDLSEEFQNSSRIASRVDRDRLTARNYSQKIFKVQMPSHRDPICTMFCKGKGKANVNSHKLEKYAMPGSVSARCISAKLKLGPHGLSFDRPQDNTSIKYNIQEKSGGWGALIPQKTIRLSVKSSPFTGPIARSKNHALTPGTPGTPGFRTIFKNYSKDLDEPISQPSK